MFFNRLINYALKSQPIAKVEFQQVRNKWPDHLMKRDHLRRKLVETEIIKRVRLNALWKNTILPRELQEVADAEIAALPWKTSITHLTNRCVVTSRPRGNGFWWRVSRFVFRHLTDYNKTSGIMRAKW